MATMLIPFATFVLGALIVLHIRKLSVDAAVKACKACPCGREASTVYIVGNIAFPNKVRGVFIRCAYHAQHIENMAMRGSDVTALDTQCTTRIDGIRCIKDAGHEGECA